MTFNCSSLEREWPIIDGPIAGHGKSLMKMEPKQETMRIGYDAKRIFHNGTGLGNYGRDFVRLLRKQPFISDLILYNTKPSDNFEADRLGNISIKYPQDWIWKKLPSLWRLIAVRNQIKADNLDIFHGLSGEIPMGLPKKIASVVSIHDLIFLSHPNYYTIFDRFIYKKKMKYAADNANLIIAVSEQTKRDIIKYLRVDENKIRVVYQGCNAAYKVQYSVQQKECIKKKYNLPKEFVLNVGTIQERKNVLMLVKAIHTTDFHLIIIGNEKKYAKKVHKYITVHGLQERIHFLKNVPVTDLAIIYQLSTVFCYPSICEGFGIPIIESLFSKTPVITSKGSCFLETGGPDSIYVDPYDRNALRRKLVELFNDAPLRQQIAEKGYSYAQRFCDGNVVKNTYAVYDEVLDKTYDRESSRAPTTNKITALLITFNEIEHIDGVVENLSFTDEIIVIDSFSTDGTIDRIKAHENVKLIQRPFKNFTDQKSFALEQASHDWVLFLDADERITDNLKKEILEVVYQKKTKEVAYYFYRVFMFKNKRLLFSGWQTDKNYRLFRKSRVHYKKERIVHETLNVNGKSGTLKHKLVHYSYMDYESYKNKIVKYGKMKALQEFQKGNSPSPLHIMYRPLYKFINNYIIRLGVLDGKKGIIICYLNALGVYARYKEHKKLKKEHGQVPVP